MRSRETLLELEPAQIAAYLRSTGWTPAETRKSSIQWQLSEPERGRSVVLVTDRRDPDYEDYTTILFARLRDVEGRGDDAIYFDVLNAGRDTMTIAVAAPTIGQGEVPVSYGAELFRATRDLMAAGGRSVIGTRAKFGGPPPENVRDALDRLTFGQTRAGSYIITVKTPVDQQLVMDDPGAAIGFERRTIARTVEAVAAAQTAAQHLGDENAIDDAIERGVSQQLCAALEAIDPRVSGATVRLSSQWGKGLPTPPSTPESIELEMADFSRLRSLGEMLGALTPEPDYHLEGWIKEISFASQWDPYATVTVEGRVKGRKRDVRITLSGPALEDARQLAGKGHVKARGTLEKAGRAWVMTKPDEVSITEDSAPRRR